MLAIKFSNSLTKDMVFSGLRDTIKKIGEFVDRGYEIEIPFTFGTLTAKERRVKFEFNLPRLQEVRTKIFLISTEVSNPAILLIAMHRYYQNV